MQQKLQPTYFSMRLLLFLSLTFSVPSLNLRKETKVTGGSVKKIFLKENNVQSQKTRAAVARKISQKEFTIDSACFVYKLASNEIIKNIEVLLRFKFRKSKTQSLLRLFKSDDGREAY